MSVLTSSSKDLEQTKPLLEDVSPDDNRPPFILSKSEVKILFIAGTGFFLDAYDLFIINPVSNMLNYLLYDGHGLPSGLEGFMKAGANIGSVIGQFLFGYLASSLSRKIVYGKELVIIIIATILCMADPTSSLSPSGALIWLAAFRILLGIGVGGDYPLSASVATERSRLRRRGALLTYVFANQGWGSFVGSLVAMIVLAIYKHVINDEGEISKVDGVWRIAIGFSLIPAFLTLYQRVRLPESQRFKAVKVADLHRNNENGQENAEMPMNIVIPGTENATRPSHLREIIDYFSEWRHAKILIGTSMSWFFLDIAFYGINLNQTVVLQQIGFAGTGGTAWHNLWEIAVGNLIITALGFLPGYYATVLTIEYFGRKWIQIQGFLLEALFLAILAINFHTLSTPVFCVCFALLQFFFNFGANATTFLYPAEVFPTRFRAVAHGISAAFGKTGAIISALGFNTLSKNIGTPAVLWIFFGCCLAGAACTLLLPEVKGRDPDVIEAKERRASPRI